MGDDRPAVYLEGNTVIYRASALGHCLRSLWAARSNMPRKPIPEPIKKAMDEGTELESTILNDLFEKHHWGFSYNGQQFGVELNVGAWNGNTLVVRGHVDEIRDDGLPVDVKAFAASGVDDWYANGPKDYYLWQQSVYTHGLGKDRYYMPIYNKDTKEIEASSLSARLPKYSREQIRDRVLLIEEAFHAGIMPIPCTADYACQYPYIHDSKDSETIPDNTVTLVTARLKLSEKIRTLDAARKTLDKAIQPKLQEGVSYKYQGWTVSIVANPDKFNTVAAKQLLREAGIDYEKDPMFIIPGEGSYVRMNPPRKPRG